MFERDVRKDDSKQSDRGVDHRHPERQRSGHGLHRRDAQVNGGWVVFESAAA